MSADLNMSDAKLKPAFDALKDSKSSQNWLAYGLEGKTNKVQLVGSGEGGLAELTAVLAEDRVIWALLRAVGADVQANVTSNREKFVYICWIGPKVGVMQRAKVGMQSRGILASFVGVSLAISVDASSEADLTMESLAKRLLACGGAHKPTKYVFGPGQEYSLLEILGAAGPRAGFVPSAERSPSSPSSSPSAAAEQKKEDAPAEAAPAAE
jgi:hypothetical protein